MGYLRCIFFFGLSPAYNIFLKQPWRKLFIFQSIALSRTLGGKVIASKCPKCRLLSAEDLLVVNFNLTALWCFLYICIEQKEGGDNCCWQGMQSISAAPMTIASDRGPPHSPDSFRNALACPFPLSSDAEQHILCKEKKDLTLPLFYCS